MTSEDDKERWERIRLILNKDRRAMLNAWNSMDDPVEAMRHGLRTEKFTAFEFLLLHCDDELNKSVFEMLVDHASVAHGCIHKNRAIIKMMSRKWVIEHIEPIVNHILTDETDAEEYYTRFAELYSELDDGLLNRLLDRAAQHDNPAVVEISEDYRA